jgi:hypothetical protein
MAAGVYDRRVGGAPGTPWEGRGIYSRRGVVERGPGEPIRYGICRGDFDVADGHIYFVWGGAGSIFLERKTRRKKPKVKA